MKCGRGYADYIGANGPSITWDFVSLTVPVPGGNTMVRLVANGESGPNVDTINTIDVGSPVGNAPAPAGDFPACTVTQTPRKATTSSHRLAKSEKL